MVWCKSPSEAPLDELMAEPDALQSATKSQVREAFARYATDQNQVTVVITPKAE